MKDVKITDAAKRACYARWAGALWDYCELGTSKTKELHWVMEDLDKYLTSGEVKYLKDITYLVKMSAFIKKEN